MGLTTQCLLPSYLRTVTYLNDIPDFADHTVSGSTSL